MTTSLPKFQHALLVIDVQASFSARPYFVADDVSEYLNAQNALIQGFLDKKQPVIRIYHVDGEGSFSKSSGLVKPLDGLKAFEPALTIEKVVHSAFAGTALAQWLTQRGIQNVCVSDIRTEQCCETTTRHGSDLGFKMTYVTEATATFPMQHAKGRQYTPAEIKERTELVLAGRFAAIKTVAETLAAL